MTNLVDDHPLVVAADAALAELARRRAGFEANVTALAEQDAAERQAYEEALDKACWRVDRHLHSRSAGSPKVPMWSRATPSSGRSSSLPRSGAGMWQRHTVPRKNTGVITAMSAELSDG